MICIYLPANVSLELSSPTLYWFSSAAVINSHTFCGLKQHKHVLSWFQRSEVWQHFMCINSVSALPRLVLLAAQRGAARCLFHLLVDGAFHALWSFSPSSKSITLISASLITWPSLLNLTPPGSLLYRQWKIMSGQPRLPMIISPPQVP